MAKYFKYFPTTQYAFSNDPNAIQTVTNLTNKFTFEDSFRNNTSLFYEYSIVDGETPDILAHKIYGSSERHWIILAMNNMQNPYMDWPIESRSLNEIIEMKYVGNADVANNETGMEWAQENIHSYYKIETQTDNSTTEQYKKITQIDVTAYNALTTQTKTYTLQSGNTISVKTERTHKTYYEYEVTMNDDKRRIKILKPEYVSAVEQEFHNIF